MLSRGQKCYVQSRRLCYPRAIKDLSVPVSLEKKIIIVNYIVHVYFKDLTLSALQLNRQKIILLDNFTNKKEGVIKPWWHS